MTRRRYVAAATLLLSMLAAPPAGAHPGHHRAALPGEQREDLERLWRQWDTPAMPTKLGGLFVELEGTETQHGDAGGGSTHRTLIEHSARAQCQG
jgi:hypothetical protein